MFYFSSMKSIFTKFNNFSKKRKYSKCTRKLMKNGYISYNNAERECKREKNRNTRNTRNTKLTYNHKKRKTFQNENSNFIDKLPMFEPIANGSFGTVFYGIPDIKNPSKNLNTTVNKAYYKLNQNKIIPKAYIKELELSEKIKKSIPSQTIITTPYGTLITKKELLDHMPKGIMKNDFISKNRRSSYEIVQMITMPNLGIDIHTMVYKYKPTMCNDSYINKIAVELLKLLNVVHEININGYIHGDISDTNILINVNEKDFGNMTIIDFDYFGPKINFINNEKSLYSTPPEYMVLKYVIDNTVSISEKLKDNNIRSFLYSVINKLTYNKYMDWVEDVCFKHVTDNYNYIRNIEKNIRIFFSRDKSSDDLLKELLDSIDLYGLGMCMNVLLKKCYHNNDDNIILQFIFQELLPNIMNGKPNENYNITPFKRWSIQEAIDNYTAFLVPYCQTHNISIPEGYMLYQNKNIIP